MMDEHFVQLSYFLSQIIASWLVWFQGRDSRTRASNWGAVMSPIALLASQKLLIDKFKHAELQRRPIDRV